MLDCDCKLGCSNQRLYLYVIEGSKVKVGVYCTQQKWIFTAVIDATPSWSEINLVWIRRHFALDTSSYNILADFDWLLALHLEFYKLGLVKLIDDNLGRFVSLKLQEVSSAVLDLLEEDSKFCQILVKHPNYQVVEAFVAEDGVIFIHN